MNNQKTAQKITSFFNDESKDMWERHEEDGIPKSMKQQVKSIINAQPDLVLDVGSGPGSLIIQLLEQGVDSAIGLDLSDSMNDIALRRLKQRNWEDKVKLLKGDFLTTDIDKTPDAISLHRVLCCHPDRNAMLQKSVTYQPKTITVTIPRDWKILRMVVGIIGLIAKFTDSFRPYIHSQKSVDEKMTKLGYYKENQEKDWWWVTTTYKQK